MGWYRLPVHALVAALGFGPSFLSSLIVVGERLCLLVLHVSRSALPSPLYVTIAEGISCSIRPFLLLFNHAVPVL